MPGLVLLVQVLQGLGPVLLGLEPLGLVPVQVQALVALLGPEPVLAVLRAVAEGAQLAFCTAGAYCAVLANHYNGRALPAEVLLEDDGTARLIRPAVSDEDMIAREQAL